MKQELEELGIKLAKLAKKYNEDYLTLTYIDKCIIGNSTVSSIKRTDIYLDEEEVKKRCLTD